MSNFNFIKNIKLKAPKLQSITFNNLVRTRSVRVSKTKDLKKLVMNGY